MILTARAPAQRESRRFTAEVQEVREVLDPLEQATYIFNAIHWPVREKFLVYAPIEDVARAQQCAMLFIAAEREELFDNRDHPELAFKRAPEPKRYVVIPGIPHYGIYGVARDEATRLAVEWFDAHLKP